jgi:hypothetical protein
MAISVVSHAMTLTKGLARNAETVNEFRGPSASSSDSPTGRSSGT